VPLQEILDDEFSTAIWFHYWASTLQSD